MTKTPFLFAMFFILLLAGCTKTDNFKSNNADKPVIQADGQASKVMIQTDRKTYKAVLYSADYITTAKSGKAGQTIFFKDVGNKHLDVDFVPSDPRRGGRTNITYAIDNETTTDNGLSHVQVATAINNAMATWEAVKCSELNLTEIPHNGDLGWVQAFSGFGGSLDQVADIQHSGFLPGAFFDQIAPGGSSFILGITYHFIFFDEDGNVSDIDGNGLADVSFAEIYYNDNFVWSTNSSTGIDIESIALHESGHGLSQAHFGKAFLTNSNGKLHFTPKAVMNAAYSGEQRSLRGTDNGGHCSIWANWPKK
ncbi:hypothetical protein OCK74_13315 [Chitinophagaceae bacterium LB-8]|uniref:Peptidase M10 metallopeptidase domain-containing protein n=1 Tax=Paraflavisolibacter caeni TaxID=2982496 RepID=A0A9X2XX13_9BACT|nr:hypothetical protein [Paraflavisolibacter caeni]MCU7550097.1 hypothetical protein [Paraflavisolibacter caeni]